MWNNKTPNLELISELGTIELEPVKGCYLLKKTLGKVSITSLDSEQFYSMFSLPTVLKVGIATFKIELDEFNPIVKLEYICPLSESAFSAASFSKLYADIKDDIALCQSVYFNYITYLKSLANKVNSSKSKTQQPAWDFSKFNQSAEDIINNINTTNKEENNED